MIDKQIAGTLHKVGYGIRKLQDDDKESCLLYLSAEDLMTIRTALQRYAREKHEGKV